MIEINIYGPALRNILSTFFFASYRFSTDRRRRTYFSRFVTDDHRPTGVSFIFCSRVNRLPNAKNKSILRFAYARIPLPLTGFPGQVFPACRRRHDHRRDHLVFVRMALIKRKYKTNERAIDRTPNDGIPPENISDPIRSEFDDN